MSSIRLLSPVHSLFRDPAKPRIKYIPLLFRMWQRQYTEIIEAQTHRVVRTEPQLKSTALFDETPTIGIESLQVKASFLHGNAFSAMQ